MPHPGRLPIRPVSPGVTVWHCRICTFAASKDLHDTGPLTLVREMIAKRIIEAAKKGERDPVRLRAAGLAALGYDREAS